MSNVPHTPEAPLGALALALVALLAPSPGAVASADPPLLPESPGVRDLFSAEPSARARGAAELAWEPGSDWVVPLLIERLREEREPEPTVALLRALAVHGGPVAREAVLAIARDRRKRLSAVPALSLLAQAPDDSTARASAAVTLVSILLDAPSESLLDALPAGSDAAVAPLIAALARPPVAVYAVRALGRLADARATPALVRLLEGNDPLLRVAAAEALGSLQDVRAAPALASRLTDPDPVIARLALRALERAVDPSVAAQVVAAAREPAARPAIFAVLARLDGDAPRLALEEAVGTASPGERRAALAALAARGDPASAPGLERLAASAEPRLRGLVLAVLAELRDGAGRDALLRLAERPGLDGDLAIRALAVLAQRRGERDPATIALATRRSGLAARASAALAGDGGAARALLRALAEPDAATRAMAASLVAAIRPSGCEEAVAAALPREADVRARRALAVAALGCGSRSARPWLSRLVSEVDDAAPEAALALAAAPLITEDARRVLRAALGAEDGRLRAAAALALGQLVDRRAAYHLARLLRRDAEARVRAAAARALSAVGAGRQLHVLRAASLLDPDASVRREARDAWLAATGQRPALVYATGRTLLRVRALGSSGEPLAGADADVTTPDGRRVRVVADPLGDVLVGGTVAGDALVDVAPRLP